MGFGRICTILFLCCTFAGCEQPKPKMPADQGPGIDSQASAQANHVQAAAVRQPDAGEPARTLSPVSGQLSRLHAKYKHVFILQGSSKKRQVALTFDDAPDGRFTPQILDMLKRNGVRATFFIVGSRAEKHPQTVRRILREGHVIGNHSYNHPNFQKLGNTRFRNEVLAANHSIQNITGRSPRLIRPPYGNVNEEQIKWLASRSFKIINWNVDSLDWKGLSAQQVTHNVITQTRPGSIILQHAGGGRGEDLTGTVQALPNIIRKLREQGMKFVTVPELLDIPAY